VITNRSKATGRRITAPFFNMRRFTIDTRTVKARVYSHRPRAKPPNKPSSHIQPLLHAESYGPTKKEVAGAASRAAKSAAHGHPTEKKTLWELARISLRGTRTQDQEDRFALQEYIAQQMHRAIERLTPLQQIRLGKMELDIMAQNTVKGIHQDITKMVARGKRLRYCLPGDRVIVHAATPGARHRNCFLVCRKEPNGLRVIAAQTAGRFQRTQRNRIRQRGRDRRSL